MLFSPALSRGSSTYVIVEEAQTHTEAIGTCLVRGGHLVVINSKEEFDVIRTMLLQYRAGGATVPGFWVDGTDRFTPNQWFCATLQGPCPWVVWNPGEGENVNQDCAGIWPNVADGLDDDFCTDERPFPVCEFECE